MNVSLPNCLKRHRAVNVKATGAHRSSVRCRSDAVRRGALILVKTFCERYVSPESCWERRPRRVRKRANENHILARKAAPRAIREVTVARSFPVLRMARVRSRENTCRIISDDRCRKIQSATISQLALPGEFVHAAHRRAKP